MRFSIFLLKKNVHQQLFFSEIICIPVKNTPYSCKGFIPAPRQTLELVTLDVGAQVRLHTAYCTKGSNKGQISIVRGLTLNICLGDGVHHSKRNIFQLKSSKTMRSLMRKHASCFRKRRKEKKGKEKSAIMPSSNFTML